jgi:hypothetical protein
MVLLQKYFSNEKALKNTFFIYFLFIIYIKNHLENINLMFFYIKNTLKTCKTKKRKNTLKSQDRVKFSYSDMFSTKDMMPRPTKIDNLATSSLMSTFCLLKQRSQSFLVNVKRLPCHITNPMIITLEKQIFYVTMDIRR